MLTKAEATTELMNREMDPFPFCPFIGRFCRDDCQFYVPEAMHKIPMGETYKYSVTGRSCIIKDKFLKKGGCRD